MNINDIESAPPLTKIDYVVYKENTLGYLFKTSDGSLYLEVLASNRHGLDWRNGPHFINGTHFIGKIIYGVRKATLDDFKRLRLSPKGHIS